MRREPDFHPTCAAPGISHAAPLGARLLLFGVSALALALRVWVSGRQPMNYNGGWHLFIARNLTREYRNLAHPPLFLLLLKVCDAASHTLLAYRFIPILAGVGSVVLVGTILEKLGTLRPVAVFGAFLVACSQSAILLSLEMEGYTLCVFFVLVSLSCYLDIAPAESFPAARSRIGFATSVCLALLSHFFAGLYLAACVLAPLAAASLHSGYWRAWRREFPRRWRADLLTLVPPALLAAALYWFLAKPWAMRLSSFPLFYFRPGQETLSSFWIRNLRETFNLFAPVTLPRARYALPLLGGFVAIVTWSAASERRGRSPVPNRLLPSLIFLVLLLLEMALGALGRYPFGGMMRHQFLLFVFAVLSGFVALDRLLRGASSRDRAIGLALCFGAVVAGFSVNLARTIVPAYESEALVARKGIFRKSLSDARVVHLDQFNLIGMVMDYDSWDWRFVGPVPKSRRVERYELTRGAERLVVIAHRGIWLMDFLTPALYAELRDSFAGKHDGCEIAFCVYRNFYGPQETSLPESARADLESRIPRLAGEANLETRGLEVSDDAIHADFCIREGVGQPGSLQ